QTGELSQCSCAATFARRASRAVVQVVQMERNPGRKTRTPHQAARSSIVTVNFSSCPLLASGQFKVGRECPLSGQSGHRADASSKAAQVFIKNMAMYRAWPVLLLFVRWHSIFQDVGSPSR